MNVHVNFKIYHQLLSLKLKYLTLLEDKFKIQVCNPFPSAIFIR